MEEINHLTIGLIIGGALILLFAIIQTHRIFRLVESPRLRRGWRILFVLMSFFFIGYFGVAYIVSIEEFTLLQVLTGVIFFFGAVFVFLVVALGSGTLKTLKNSKDDLEEKLDLLKAQNEQLQQFNNATSHDLKEPINTVMGSITILKDQYADELGEKGNTFLEYAMKGVNRMTELVSGLSDYLKAGASKQMKLTDMKDLINDVVDEMQGSIKETNASVTIHDMPQMAVNDLELKRVFQNLISNAIKNRKEDVPPEIDIYAIKREEDFWEFNVQDNGIGIKEEDFVNLFQLFRRLNKGKYEGMGVGLAITKKVVELHGGEIWLESREGDGTKFIFTLKA